MAETNVWLGIIGVVSASVIWGTAFIVTKRYDLPKDGVHFAFLMSIGIMLVGIFSLFSSELENGDFKAVFSPYGLLGGGLWACGNFLSVPIIERVGLGVGFALWAGTQMIVAFLVGALALQESLERPICGGFGVVLAILALVLFAKVKQQQQQKDSHEAAGGDDSSDAEAPVELDPQNPSDCKPPLDISETSLSTSLSGHASGGKTENDEEMASTKENPLQIEIPPNDNASMEDDNDVAVLSPKGTRRNRNIVWGVLLAVVAGLFYGVQFVPLSMWNTRVTDSGFLFDDPLPSDAIRSLRFFFSQFTGIFLGSTLGFLLYYGIRGQKPNLVPPEATIPSILCGMVWALGCCGAMLATIGLGNAVGSPLLLNGCILVNSTWSILYFREIQGWHNLRIFGAAFALNVSSSVLISLAKGS
jgi:glucose uptake protein GlcU